MTVLLEYFYVSVRFIKEFEQGFVRALIIHYLNIPKSNDFRYLRNHYTIHCMTTCGYEWISNLDQTYCSYICMWVLYLHIFNGFSV